MGKKNRVVLCLFLPLLLMLISCSNNRTLNLSLNKGDFSKSKSEVGKACLIMGIGMILMIGIIKFTSNTAYGLICFGIFFVCGLVMMFMTQKKYNGGL